MRHKLKRWLHRLLNAPLASVEKVFLPREADLCHPPVFVIGCPRSGTTLCAQLLIHRFRLAYPSNVFRYFPRAPWLGTVLLAPFLRPPTEPFTSDYGRMRGLGAPCEAGAFFERWFPHFPTHVEAEPDLVNRLSELRRYIAAFSRRKAAPMILKNTYNSLRIGPLAAAVPEALFVRVERRAVDTALSILRAREALFNSQEMWFSLAPPDFEVIRRLPPHEQVLRQIISIDACIERDLERFVDPDRVLGAKYEAFCENPQGFAETFEEFFAGHGTRLVRAGELPEEFPRRKSNDTKDDRTKLENLLDSIKLQ